MTKVTPDQALAGGDRLGGIEALRAFAAAAVVIFHVIHIAGVAVPQSLEFMKWYFGFGVPLFFVVSAFSLAYGYDDRLSGWRQIGVFYVRRFFRIAPLYYLMLVFTLQQWGALSPSALANQPLASALTFTFNLFPGAVEGIVPASWSIGVEMLFYAILPALLPLIRSTGAAIVFTLGAIVVAVIYAAKLHGVPDVPHAFIQHGFLFNLPYFGFGLIAAKAYHGTSPMAAMRSLVLGAAGLVALYGVAALKAPLLATPAGNAAFQMLWGAPFGLICLGAAIAPTWLISNPVTRFLGLISYSLYLVHPHVISFLIGFHAFEWVGSLGGGSGVRFPVATAMTFAVLVPLSWLTYTLVEAPGMKLGRRVSSLLNARRPLVRAPAAAE